MKTVEVKLLLLVESGIVAEEVGRRVASLIQPNLGWEVEQIVCEQVGYDQPEEKPQ